MDNYIIKVKSNLEDINASLKSIINLMKDNKIDEEIPQNDVISSIIDSVSDQIYSIKNYIYPAINDYKVK